MAAMIFKGPPQRGQCSRSISNTRSSNIGPSSGGQALRQGRLGVVC